MYELTRLCMATSCDQELNLYPPVSPYPVSLSGKETSPSVWLRYL